MAAPSCSEAAVVLDGPLVLKVASYTLYEEGKKRTHELKKYCV